MMNPDLVEFGGYPEYLIRNNRLIRRILCFLYILFLRELIPFRYVHKHRNSAR